MEKVESGGRGKVVGKGRREMSKVKAEVVDERRRGRRKKKWKQKGMGEEKIQGGVRKE